MYGGIYLSEPLLNQIKSDALPIKYDHQTRKFMPSESWCSKMSEIAMYTSLAPPSMEKLNRRHIINLNRNDVLNLSKIQKSD